MTAVSLYAMVVLPWLGEGKMSGAVQVPWRQEQQKSCTLIFEQN